MAQEIKFQRTGRIPSPIFSLNQSSSKASNAFHVPQNKILQSMVQGRYRQSLQCPLPQQRLGQQSTHQQLSSILPITDSKSLQNSTPAQRNYLMADCIVVEITRESAVQRKTHKKQARAWKHWGEYNKFIGNKDLFLESFSWHQQIKLIRAIALALHEGWFSGPAHDKLVESTVSGTIQYVCTTFRENSFPNPSFNEDAISGFILQQLYWAFRKADPAEKHQKEVPMCVIAKIGKKTLSELSIAVFQLACLAIFFACQSCKYCKVPPAKQGQTTILCLQNIRFFRDGKLIDHNNPELEYLDAVSLTFEKQKKDEKMDTITQMALGDVKLCPVRAAAAIVKQI